MSDTRIEPLPPEPGTTGEGTPPSPAAEAAPGGWQGLKKLTAPIGIGALLGFKWFAKLKFLALPVLKFLPLLLKTGGTMLLSMWAYALSFGWKFAVGFVVLIFVHECGHLLVARRFGLKVGAPMFIPFVGAFIALKDAPKDAWMEAWVGLGGPLLGAFAALVCEEIYLITGNPLFRGLAYSGFVLNLFNLTPIGFLDGGRIATAISPWLWVIGAVVMAALLFVRPNLIVGLILLMSLPRLWQLLRRKTDEEKRYFEVTPRRRWAMAGMYFGLIAALLLGLY